MTPAVPRISYHSFGPASNVAYLGALETVIRREADRCGLSVVLRPTRNSCVRAKQHRSLHPLDVAELTHDVWQCVSGGAAGVVIGNIQDPGLYECRQLVDVPVAGLLESVFTATFPFGARIGLILTNTRVEPLLRERLRIYGLTDRLASVHTIDTQLTDLSAVFSTGVPAPLVEAVAGCVRAARAQGADMIVPGSGMLAVVIDQIVNSYEEGEVVLNELNGLAVVSPIAAALSTLRAAMCLRDAGTAIGRRGVYEAPDRQQVVEYFQRLHGHGDGS
jgi:Asp/Glu/hydantoin racemase